MRKYMVTLFLALSIIMTGCFGTVPKTTILSAKVTKSGLVKLQKEMDQLDVDLKAYLEAPSPETKEGLLKSYNVAQKAIKASISAVNALCDAVIILDEDIKEID